MRDRDCETYQQARVKRNSIGILLALVLAPMVVVYPVSAEALSLKEALATAYATNPQIEAARANLRATDEELAKAIAGWRPSLSLSSTDGFQHIITDQPVHSDDDRNLVCKDAAPT